MLNTLAEMLNTLTDTLCVLQAASIVTVRGQTAILSEAFSVGSVIAVSTSLFSLVVLIMLLFEMV